MTLTFKKIQVIFLFLNYIALYSNLVDDDINELAIVYIYEKAAYQEGLVGVTHIKTAHGYIALQNLSLDNKLTIPNSNELQNIILIEKSLIPYFYEIRTNNYILQCAPAQKIYDFYHDIWLQAKDFSDQNYIGNDRVISVIKVNKYIQLYKVNTAQHIFELEHDIIVHNFDISAACNIGITIGQLTLKHPIINAIGKTISLVKLAAFIYKDFQERQQQAIEYLDMLTHEDVVIETRAYYEVRRKQLLELLQQYQIMQSFISTIISKNSFGISLFPQIKPTSSISLLPALQTELTYSSNDKHNLLLLREQELATIEQEIIKIQLNCAIYLDEIVIMYDDLSSKIDQLAQEGDYITILWDPQYADQYSLYDVLYLSIENIIYLDSYVKELEKISKELLGCLDIYEHKPKCLEFRKTSNVVEISHTIRNKVTSRKNYLIELKSSIDCFHQLNNNMLQKYPIIDKKVLQNFIFQAQEELNNQNQQHKTNAKIKQSNINFPTPPDDPDQDNNKNKKFDKEKYPHHLNGISENIQDVIHMFRDKIGKLKDTGENRQRILDLVRDKRNCYGQDEYGVVGYAVIEADGSQLWAEVNPLTHRVRNCGVNEKPRAWNSTTGFKAQPFKNK